MKAELTADALRQVLCYDKETGVFTWRSRRGSRAAAGAAAGFDNCGYVGIRIFKVRHLAHRLAWLYVTGSWPSGPLDHINTIKSDNRFVNLRECTKSENTANVGTRSDNKTGLKGVCFEKQTQRWKAQIRKNGKSWSLGRFDSPELAHQAYAKAARELFGEFARTTPKEKA